MSDYKAWSNFCLGIMNEIFENVKKIETSITVEQQIRYRRQYMDKCDEWLLANEVMVKRITDAKGRIENQIDIINGTACCERCRNKNVN